MTNRSGPYSLGCESFPVGFSCIDRRIPALSEGGRVGRQGKPVDDDVDRQEKLPNYKPLARFNDEQENTATNSLTGKGPNLSWPDSGSHNDGVGDRR